MRIRTIRTPSPAPHIKRRGAPVAPNSPPPPFVYSFPIKLTKRTGGGHEPRITASRRPSPYASAILFHAATQYINFPTIPSDEFFPTPSFTGGLQRLQLFIAGVAIPLFNPAGAGSAASACTISSQTIGRSTATFDIWVSNGSYAPVLGQTVLFVENGATLFSGCIDTKVADKEFGTRRGVTFHCIALDKSSICDRRNGKIALYPAGSDVAQTINSVVTAYLNGEGINTNGVPTDGSLGVLTSDLPINYNTVAAIFNSIATQSGTVWWVDQYGVLFFSALTELPDAPFPLRETDPIYVNVDSAGGGGGGGQCTVTSTLSGAGATSGYRNRQYVVTNLNVLPGSGSGGSGGGTGSNTVETFTFANGQPGITSNYNPSGVLVPDFINVNLPIATILSITVNGVDQTFYEITQQAGQQFTGGTDYVWYYASTTTIAGMGGSNQFLAAQGVFAIPSGATVVITYVPGSNTSSSAAQVGEALVPTDPSGGTFGTCGSGIFEAVLQVQNISSQEDLNAIAQAELNKSGGIPQILNCFTNKSGLQVGQMVEAYFPSLELPGTGTTPVKMLITAVSGTANTQPLNYGSYFTWAIQATTNLDPGNWITYFTNMINRSANPQPVLQQEPKTFILAPSGSLAAGVVQTNPNRMAATGRLLTLSLEFTLPPEDQDAVATFTDVTSGVILGSVTVPANSTAQAIVNVPASANLYAFQNDLITCTITYVNIGGSPVAASMGTATAVFVH